MWHVTHPVIHEGAGQSLHVIVPEVAREVQTLRENYVQQRDTCGRQGAVHSSLRQVCHVRMLTTLFRQTIDVFPSGP